MDFCSLQFPSSTSTAAGVATENVYGRVFEDTITQPAGAHASVTAQLGYGPPTANPEYEPDWTWIPATFNVQIGNDDEYRASITAPAPGEYRYTYRFSRDGRSWTYCDADGAGANIGLTFSVGKLGVLTVTP